MRVPLLIPAALLLAGCLDSRGPEISRPVPTLPADAAGLIQHLASEDTAVARAAFMSLRVLGEPALAGLEKAAGGPPSRTSARAGRLADLIRADLVARDRLIDDAFLAGHDLHLPPDRTGAWHRYVAPAGKDRTVELGSFAPGDVGVPLRKPGLEVGLPGEDRWIPLSGGGAEDWQEAAVALGERDAIRLGLGRHEIPGHVIVRSRVGAGVLATAWRAEASVRSAGGAAVAVEVWVVPESEEMP